MSKLRPGQSRCLSDAFWHHILVWNPLSLHPSDGVFGWSDVAALLCCHILFVCFVVAVAIVSLDCDHSCDVMTHARQAAPRQ